MVQWQQFGCGLRELSSLGISLYVRNIIYMAAAVNSEARQARHLKEVC